MAASVVLDDEPAPRVIGSVLVPRLVGDAGLAQEPLALRALVGYFEDGPSELRAISANDRGTSPYQAFRETLNRSGLLPVEWLISS